jgi:KDO2-lipid IV(A) lauroyltransferase
MKLDLQSLTTSQTGVALMLGIGRFIPPQIGYRVTDIIARWLASRRHNPMTIAVRANQWVVAADEVTPQQLDEMVLKTFRHHTRSLYMYYRHLFNPATSGDLIEFSPDLVELIQKTRDSQFPMIIVAIHMSNFDLVGYSAFKLGVKALALSLDNPKSGHRRQNEIRKGYGFDVVPASVSTIRLAEKRLREGGTVLTGIDRPLPQSKYYPKFFGRPATLPVMHIILSMRTNVPVFVVAPIMGPDGKFRVLASKPVSMEQHENRRTAITRNAEKVLSVAEGFIRQAPFQWVMFYPVWPGVIEQVP